MESSVRVLMSTISINIQESRCFNTLVTAGKDNLADDVHIVALILAIVPAPSLMKDILLKSLNLLIVNLIRNILLPTSTGISKLRDILALFFHRRVQRLSRLMLGFSTSSVGS